MSDGFSEGILFGGDPKLTIDFDALKLDPNACITVPAEPNGCYITAIDPKSWALDFTFASAGKPVLTITKDGELIFENVTEAALALKAEWDRLRGQ